VSQDPFDEFEFRPITEGLGFHKRKESIAEPALPTKPQVTKIVVNSIKGREPATQARPTIEMPITNSTVDSVLDSLKTKRNALNFEESRTTEPLKGIFQKVAPTKAWEASLPDISAIILDSMLVLAGVLASLIVTILITQADLIAWGKQLSIVELTASLYALFASISFIYTTVCRTFLGFTAGEWVTDQAITTRSKTGFKFLGSMMARSALNIVTFYVTLPMLSNAMGQDLAGQLTGAQLSKEKL